MTALTDLIDVDQQPATPGFDRLPAISLEELNDAAALQRRVDRKYLVDRRVVAELVSALGHRVAALDVDGVRSFGYESTYFDTADLECFRAAAHRRRHRFKVRTRTYLESATTMLEVKTRGSRNVTVKRRCHHRFDERDRLPDGARRVVDDWLDRPGIAASLRPTLTSEYRRTTLVDLDDVARVTIDAGLRCTDWVGDSVAPNDVYVLETKSDGSPSSVDRWLWSNGIRPERISKFGTGLAALHPELPANKWHRTLQRYFPATP